MRSILQKRIETISNSTLHDNLNDLALRAQEGDRQAYQQFLQGIHPYIKGAIRRKLGAIVDQEDLAQECLMAIHKNLSTYDPSQPIKPWVSAIIRYKLADHFRGLAKRKEQLLGNDEFDVTNQLQDTNKYSETSGKQAAQVLNKLPVKLKRAIELTHLKGMSYSDAAKKEGVSEVALRKRISRGFAQIRADVARDMEI